MVRSPTALGYDYPHDLEKKWTYSDMEREAGFLQYSVSKPRLSRLANHTHHELRVGSWEIGPEHVRNIGHVVHHPTQYYPINHSAQQDL